MSKTMWSGNQKLGVGVWQAAEDEHLRFLQVGTRLRHKASVSVYKAVRVAVMKLSGPAIISMARGRG